MKRIRALAISLAVLTLSVVPSGVGAQEMMSKPTVRIGSTNFTEQLIVGELYGQVLEANGYGFERRFNLGAREIVAPALESGQFDMTVEYLATYVTSLTKDPSMASTDAGQTHSTLRAALADRNLTVLDYAQAVDTNALVVTRETADRLGLRTTSDLAKYNGQLTLGAPPECPGRPFCLPGFQSTYGLAFKDFKPLDVGGPLTVAALEANQIDVALLFSSDAVIAVKGFVMLLDDKQLQLSDNVAPVVRNDLLAAAPDDFSVLINRVSAMLTTDELTALNKRVGVDRDDPKDVAAAWLKAKGLVL